MKNWLRRTKEFLEIRQDFTDSIQSPRLEIGAFVSICKEVHLYNFKFGLSRPFVKESIYKAKHEKTLIMRFI